MQLAGSVLIIIIAAKLKVVKLTWGWIKENILSKVLIM